VSSRRITAALAATALATPLLILSATPASADPDPGARLSKRLIQAADAKDAFKDLKRLQAIADANDGNRAAGTTGHEQSARYIYETAKKAGYQVHYETFDFTYTKNLAEEFSVPSGPGDVDIAAMTYTTSTPVGGIDAPLAVVPKDADTGCDAGDYAAGSYTGAVALIQRGGCTFAEKQAAAADAGAAAAVIYNNTDGPLGGTLGEADAGRIPTGGITQADGEALAGLQGATVHLEIRQFQEVRQTRNVIAETPGGDADHTVMLGAHLDSVTEGPGINDDGSGSAGLLEVARELAKSHAKPVNKVRFAWWSAEETGLDGSTAYVENLTDAQQKAISLYLNFDMIASPNYAQFVFDGDGSNGENDPGPGASARIEKNLTDFLDKQGVPHEPTAFDGRSDYGPFIDAGIPAGGTFTGAEELKTPEQAAKFGGTAGVALDPCYHQACDDLSNINMKAFEINIDVIADAVARYSMDLGSLQD
jgi:Zn-dependent M28 family amino/carboxypeptidase